MIDRLLKYIKLFPNVTHVEYQSDVDIQNNEKMVVIRVYMVDDKPPDLGIHVGDGLGVKLERGE